MCLKDEDRDAVLNMDVTTHIRVIKLYLSIDICKLLSMAAYKHAYST